MRRDNHEVNRVDHAWDGLVSGPSDPTADVDPEITGTLRQLHALDDTPGPNRSFVEGLARQLDSRATTQREQPIMGMNGVDPDEQHEGMAETTADGPTSSPSLTLSRPTRWLRETVGIAAAVAVVALVGALVAGILATRPRDEAPGGPPSPTSTPAGDHPTSTPAPPPAVAEETAVDGRWGRYQLAFNAGQDIYRIGADGEGLCRLTDASNLDAFWAWSPDGGQMAFVRYLAGDNTDIYVMNADGTNQRNLTHHPARDSTPAWSPDGSQIAFASDRNGTHGIYVMEADGSNLRRLAEFPHHVLWPVWSPDGQRIAFIREGEGDTVLPSQAELWVMNADGSGLHNLTPDGVSVTWPLRSAWSPDGQRLVVASSDGERGWLSIVGADGSGWQRLPADDLGAGFPTDPAWSPTGEWIAFYRSIGPATGGTGEEFIDHQLSLVAPDGSGLRRIAVPMGTKGPMHWSPDGQAISFANRSPDGHELALHVVEIDTGQVHTLIDAGVELHTVPVWRPTAASTEQTCANPVSRVQPREPTPEEVARREQRRAKLEQIVAALEPAGLVFEIGREVTVAERTVRLKRLLVDREVVYLDYEVIEGQGGVQFGLSTGDAPLGLWSGGLDYGEFRGSLDPSATTVTIRVMPSERNPSEHVDVTVPVDLTPLRALAAPQSIEATATGHGVRLETGQLTHGVAVSTLELTATITDPAAAVLSQQQPGPRDIFEITATAGSKPVQVLGLSALRFDAEGAHATIQLLGVPEQGELRLTVESIDFTKGLPKEVAAKGAGSIVTGPWELTLNLNA